MNRLFAFLALLLGISQVLAVSHTLEAASETFTNPLRKKDGSDPFIVYNDGYYYLMTTTWKDVQLTRARTLNGLKDGERRTVYKDGNKNRCCNVWAPEIHDIDGTWHIYFTAGQDKDLGFQRIHVIKGTQPIFLRMVSIWKLEKSHNEVADTNQRRQIPLGHIQLCRPINPRLVYRRHRRRDQQAPLLLLVLPAGRNAVHLRRRDGIAH
jgi:hypothetical protein